MRFLLVIVLVLAGIGLYFMASDTTKPAPVGTTPGGQTAQAPGQAATPPGDVVQPARAPEPEQVRTSEPAVQPAGTASTGTANPGRENRLMGSVLNDQGQPLVNAEVRLSLEPMSGEALGTIFLFGNKPLTGKYDKRTTDAKGQYSFQAIEPSAEYYLMAMHADYAASQYDRVQVAETGDSVAPDFRLKAGSNLSGYVRAEDGGAIADAQVHLDSPYMFDGSVKSPDRMSGKTDPTGYYEIKNIAAGARTITAQAEGFGTVTMMSSLAPFEGRAGDNKTQDLMLSVAAPIGGTVVDPAGKGIAGARVIAMMFQNDKSSRGETLTSDKGEFQVEGLAPGSYVLQVDAKGFRTQRANRVSTGDLAVKVEMVQKAAISGKVVDGSQALTAFTIQALRTSANPTPGAQQIYENTDVLESFTGLTDGRFELRGFDPGTYALRVSAAGFAPTISDTFTVIADQTTPPLTIRLQKGGKIEGRVVDAAGAPVAGARVATHDTNFSNSQADRIFQDLLAPTVTEKNTSSNVEGYFTLDQLAAGAYLIEVSHPRYTTEMVTNLNLGEGQSLKAGNIALSAGGSVSGTVRDASGQPVVRGIVQLINATTPNFSYDTRTDAQGRYDLQHIKPGNYRLTATRAATGDAFEGIIDQKTSDVSITVTEGLVVKRDLTVGS